jgi:hypothetical protein
MHTSHHRFSSLEKTRPRRFCRGPTGSRDGERRGSGRPVLALALAASLAASTAGAASIFEFDRWMQQVEKRALSLQKGLDRGDGEKAIADAREIERLYRSMEEYFVLSGDAASAVELSKKGWRDAADIAARTATKDTDGARSLIKGMMEDCRTCHREYKPLT